MQIAVLSDIHDNIWNLEKALARLEEAEQLIFLGDFCAPFSLKQIADAFRGPIHCVPGNNDGDMFLLMRVAGAAGNVTFYNPVGAVTVGECVIAFAHYPEIAEGLAATGKYNAVFSGHTHVFNREQVGKTLWVNPGEVMGRFGEPGFGLYQTATGEFRRVLI
ncbi:MAG: metallophosphoesterase family protein [Anaerolineae bacterium]